MELLLTHIPRVPKNALKAAAEYGFDECLCRLLSHDSCDVSAKQKEKKKKFILFSGVAGAPVCPQLRLQRELPKGSFETAEKRTPEAPKKQLSVLAVGRAIWGEVSERKKKKVVVTMILFFCRRVLELLLEDGRCDAGAKDSEAFRAAAMAGRLGTHVLECLILLV